MDAGPLELISVAGTHREVGRQIGVSCGRSLRAATALLAGAVPAGGRTRREQARLLARCREIAVEELPAFVDELDGAAEGAEVDPLELFAASAEELWERPPSQLGRDPGDGAARRTEGRCTDLVAMPETTADGHLLVAHNNDLPAGSADAVVAIERRVEGEPRSFSLGIGPWVSVGWNDAGLSITGNEVSPNDEGAGIPRLLLARAQLSESRLDAAATVGIHPRRASAYNSVLAHREGRALDVEASATAGIVLELAPDARYCHTNHYVAEEMLAFEADPAFACRSATRLGRGRAMLGSVPGAPDGGVGGIGIEDLLSMLADHENGPDAICRHPGGRDPLCTLFWCVADVSAGRVLYGKGNPCRPRRQIYELDYPASPSRRRPESRSKTLRVTRSTTGSRPARP